MKGYTGAELSDGLRSLGLRPGDTVLVHSALFGLGPLAGAAPAETAGIVLERLRSVLGDAGTVVVPAFNFDFCGGTPFDVATTPAKGMGIFSESVRQLPEAHRSPHPMQSVAAVGAAAAEICRPDTPSSFDTDGPFRRLLDLRAWLLLLGAPMQSASIVHYAEERVAVPYRYWKTFTAPYSHDAERSERSYKMYVRDMDLDPRLQLAVIEEGLRDAGQLAEERLGSGWIKACRTPDFVDLTITGLQRDPWWLVQGHEGPPG